MDGKWIFERDGACIWYGNSEEYDTKEEAIQAGKEYFFEDDADQIRNGFLTHIQVGQKVSVEIPPVDIDGLIEQAASYMYDEVGEVAEDWLGNIKKDELQLLEDRVNEAFVSWLKEVNEIPGFYKVANVSIHQIEEGRNLIEYNQ